MKRKDLPPEDVLVAFDEMAWAQRREPEEAMTAAQYALGGGVMSYVIEHVGDLTNRMARRDHIEWDSGIDYVDNKAKKTLKTLKHPYGFWREHRENMEANASYHDMSLREYDKKVDKALKKYADAHRKLPAYNLAQRAARDAAVALGEQKPKEAIEHLEYLVWLVNDDDRYQKASTFFKRRPDGSLVTL